MRPLAGLPGLEEGFRREELALLFARTRMGIVLAFWLFLVAAALDAALAPSPVAAVAVRLGGCAALAALYGLARPTASGREWGIAWATMAVLGLVLALLMRLSSGPGDPYYALQEGGLLILVMGAGALLPVGATTMLFFAAIPLAAQVVATAHFPLPDNLAYLFPGVAALVIAVALSAHGLALRRREHEVRTAQESLIRARAEFVNLLTHDLKNPLGVISGYAEILAEDETLGPEARDLVRRIQATQQKALLIAQNLLDVSKIGADGIRVRRQPVELDVFVRQLAERQRCLAEAKKIALEITDGGAPAVPADQGLLERVLVNLVDNAIKYTPNGGTVRVETRPAPGGAEIVVDDTGPGIPPELEGRLFDRFADVSHRSDSSGLGLYIVRSLVAAHGGRVSGDNRADGPGARFRVWLPAAAA